MTLTDTAFLLTADYQLTGDQPDAVAKLVEGLNRKQKHQTLLGVTGSGKTFTMANVIERANRPTLVLCPQQDPRRPALLRVPRVLPRERGRVLRLLLRLLPAGGLHPAHRHLHREGRGHQRGDRQAAPRRDAGPLRAPRRRHRRLGVLHLRSRRAGRVLQLRRCASRRARPATGSGRCAGSSTCSTSATT